MNIFDSVTADLDSIAGKVGMTPEQVAALTSTLQSKMAGLGGDKVAALEATAAQHGVSVDKIQEILNHGNAGLTEEAEGIIGGMFNKG